MPSLTQQQVEAILNSTYIDGVVHGPWQWVQLGAYHYCHRGPAHFIGNSAAYYERYFPSGDLILTIERSLDAEGNEI